MSTHVPTLDSATIRQNKLALVERLADDLAHEIKNPLHAMVINLEVLRRRLAHLDSNSNEELLRYTGVLGSELERVNRRVDMLLRMIRPNSESEESTTLAEVMEELKDLIELECQRHETRLQMDIPVAAMRINVPRAATRQMIITLVLEVLDSLAPGAVLHLSSDLQDDSVRIEFYGGACLPQIATTGPPLENGSYLDVVQGLAQRLGGRLDRVGTPPAVDGGSSTATAGYVLSLPRAPWDAPEAGTSIV